MLALRLARQMAEQLVEIEAHHRPIARRQRGPVRLHLAFAQAKRLGMANQRFDARPPIAQRAGDVFRGLVFHFAWALDPICVNPRLLKLPEIGRRVIAFVRAHRFEYARPEERRVFADRRQQTLRVVHADIGTGEGHEKIAPDAPQLKNAPKLVLLADFPFPNTGDLKTVKGQQLIGFERMGTNKMGDIQEVAPAVAREVVDHLPDVPRQCDEHRRAERH